MTYLAGRLKLDFHFFNRLMRVHGPGQLGSVYIQVFHHRALDQLDGTVVCAVVVFSLELQNKVKYRHSD